MPAIVPTGVLTPLEGAIVMVADDADCDGLVSHDWEVVVVVEEEEDDEDNKIVLLLPPVLRAAAGADEDVEAWLILK